MTDVRIPTSLRHAPSAPMTRQELDRMRADAWLKEGLIVIHPDEIGNDFIRQGMVNEATKKFGRRMRK